MSESLEIVFLPILFGIATLGWIPAFAAVFLPVLAVASIAWRYLVRHEWRSVRRRRAFTACVVCACAALPFLIVTAFYPEGRLLHFIHKEERHIVVVPSAILAAIAGLAGALIDCSRISETDPPRKPRWWLRAFGRKLSGAVPVRGIVTTGLAGSVLMASVFCCSAMAYSGIHRAESGAVKSLRAYVAAQRKFREEPRYGESVGHVYANPRDGVGMPNLFQVGYRGEVRGDRPKLGFIRRFLADASTSIPDPTSSWGYYYADITAGADGPYDYSKEFGLCAIPARYNRSGRNVFIVDVTGTIYQRDAAVQSPGLETGDTAPPLRTYPGDDELRSWIPVGD